MDSISLKVAMTTFETEAQALEFSKLIVERGWAVCAQVDSPITSVYQWEDKVEVSKEVRLWIKVFSDHLKKVESELNDFHPYDVPQWCVFQLDEIGEAYLAWACESRQGGS